MLRGRLLAAMPFLLLLSFITKAQTQIDIGEVLVEEESVNKSMSLRKESVSGKYIIPRADLVGFGYSNAGDVIKNLPMIYLDGDPGVTRNVSIGGLGREYQAILINGRQPAGGEDSRDLKLDRIPVSMIERIEIDYNTPVSEGTAGIAGTINIILKDEADHPGISIHLLSNLNTTDPVPGLRGDIEASATLGKIKLYGGLTYNSYQRLKTTELEDTSTDIKGGVEEGIVTDMAGANLSLSIPIKEYSEIDFKGFFSWFNEDEFEDADVKRRKDGTLNIRESETDNDKLRYLMTYDLAYSYKKGKDSFAAIGSFSNNFEKRHKDQLSEKSDFYEEAREYEDQDNYALNADLLYTRNDISTGGLSGQMNSGLKVSHNMRNTDRVNATRPQGYLLWDVLDESYSLDETIISAFMDYKLKIAENLVLMPALNYEYSTGTFQTADTSGNHTYGHLAPSIHIKYSLTDKFVLNAGLARHISRPAFMSMVPISKVKIKKDLIEVGNAELEPSKAITLDLGASYFINRYSYLSAKVFYKSIRDMIEMKYTGIDQATGYNLYSFVNVDTASVYGFYIDSRLDLDPEKYSGFTLHLSYTYMGSRTPDSFSGGIRRLDNQPAHLAALKIDYLNTARRFNVSTILNYNSARIIAPFLSDEDVAIPETNERAYINLAARVKYFFNGSGSIYLAGDNLLMQAVKISQGTVTETSFPGAIIRLGFNYNFSSL